MNQQAPLEIVQRDDGTYGGPPATDAKVERLIDLDTGTKQSRLRLTLSDGNVLEIELTAQATDALEGEFLSHQPAPAVQREGPHD
jgi:hypothetical protein